MQRYLQARGEKNYALEQVRSLYHMVREKGDSAPTKLRGQYKQAVADLLQSRQTAHRLHIELIDALTRGFSDQYSNDRRAAS